MPSSIPGGTFGRVTTPEDLKLRPAVRALMIDPHDRIAMVKLQWQPTGWTGWVLPGGGIEGDESHADALRRELVEETGAPQVFVGPPVMERQHLLPDMFEEWDGQQETIYLVPTHAFEIAPSLSPDQLAAENVVEVRWWTVAELAETTDVLRPEGLVELLTHVLEYGAPNPPWRIEISGDD